MRRRVLLGAAAALALGAGVLSLRPSSPALARAPEGGGVLVARRTLVAGRPIDPAQVEVVRMPASLRPRTALTETDQVAFRIAAVAIPAGLPIVPASPPSRGSRLRRFLAASPSTGRRSSTLRRTRRP